MAKQTVKVGDMVTYKGVGKVSRCEDMAGKMVVARVKAIRKNGDLVVMPTHRTLKSAMFYDMAAIVELKQVKLWKDTKKSTLLPNIKCRVPA